MLGYPREVKLIKLLKPGAWQSRLFCDANFPDYSGCRRQKTIVTWSGGQHLRPQLMIRARILMSPNFLYCTRLLILISRPAHSQAKGCRTKWSIWTNECLKNSFVFGKKPWPAFETIPRRYGCFEKPQMSLHSISFVKAEHDYDFVRADHFGVPWQRKLTSQIKYEAILFCPGLG